MAAKRPLVNSGGTTQEIASGDTLDPSCLGTISHSTLGNLSADDHTQYLLLAGRSGPQQIAGGNLGIGNTSSIGVKLQVGDASSQTTAKILGSGADKAALLSLFNTAHREGFIAQTAGNFCIGNTGGLANYTDSSLSAGANLTIDYNGKVGIGTPSPTALLDIAGNLFRLRIAKTPANSGDTGDAGDICWDSNYLYVCISTNTWKRFALSTW